MPRMEITKLDLPKCKVGEGPVWDVAEQALYYIDILERKVFRWDPASGELTTWDLPDIVGSMALREAGGAIVALGSGVHTLDFASGVVEPLALLGDRLLELVSAIGSAQTCPGFLFSSVELLAQFLLSVLQFGCLLLHLPHRLGKLAGRFLSHLLLELFQFLLGAGAGGERLGSVGLLERFG